MDEARREALRVVFDRSIKLEFHGDNVTSDAGLLPRRERDESAELTAMAKDSLTDSCTGDNIQHKRELALLGNGPGPSSPRCQEQDWHDAASERA